METTRVIPLRGEIQHLKAVFPNLTFKQRLNFGEMNISLKNMPS